MCYELIISTNYPDDLSRLNQPNIYFEKLQKDNLCQNLKYPYQYRIATMCPNGCSCSLRIFGFDMAEAFNFEFMPYQDWYEELNKDFDNAQFLFQVIKNLVNQGFNVDSFLAWNGEENNPILKTMVVKVNQTVKENFAFIHDVYFNYKK